MTDGTLKKRLAMFFFNIAEEYLSPSDVKLLRKVKRASEKVAANWDPHLSLGFPPSYWRVEVGVSKSFRRVGVYDSVKANYSACGSEDYESCAKFSALATTVTNLVGVLQAIVDEYNASLDGKAT